MENLRSIAEAVFEHKEEVPDGLYKRIMDECKNGKPELYKLTWTVVKSHAHVVECEYEPDFARVALSYQTQTLIVEAVDNRPDDGNGGKVSTMQMPNRGMVIDTWVNLPMPFVLTPQYRKDHMTIIHSIEPFEPMKRSRDA